MIFISGFGRDKKRIHQEERKCLACNKEDFLEIWMTYNYISFFFIPVIKFKKEYYATMTCCGTCYIIDPEVIKKLKKGLIRNIPKEELRNGQSFYSEKTCSCGYVSPPDFEYCPKCGRSL